MITRFYVHNFRCLENFDLKLGDLQSALLIGKNGSGKSTVGSALEVLQKIGRGTTRVGDLAKPGDFSRGRADAPMRFEIELILDDKLYSYSVAFEFPQGFRELRVAEERFLVDGKSIYTRELALVQLARMGQNAEAKFAIDWHTVALTIVQPIVRSGTDPLVVFREWLGNILILRPVPSLAIGTSERTTLRPDVHVTDIGAWFSGIVAQMPKAYMDIETYLREVMPDFDQIRTFSSVINRLTGNEARSLWLVFSRGNAQERQTADYYLEQISDGERCFVIFALVMAANVAYGPLLCFWDEPDNYLAADEVEQSIFALRRAFKDSGQLLVTTHNAEAIRSFSDENTLLLYRKSHLEPTIYKSVEELRRDGGFSGSFVDALLRGDVQA